MVERPITYCYWVVPGKLLAGEYPRDLDEATSRAKIDALVGAGVTAFVDLTEAGEGLLPYAYLLDAHTGKGVMHERFPIRDVSTPRSQQATVATLDAIDAYLAQGRTVYVHCWGGIGRTGTIVGCWLARHGYVGEHALVRLRVLWQACPKSAWRQSPETDAQEQYVIEWNEAA